MEKYIIGIDEVGRGSLAGPVVVAAVAIPFNFHVVPPLAGFAMPALHRRRRGKHVPLRDSKKLSAAQRTSWYQYFKHHPKVFYAVAKVYHKAIDSLNISHAANLAAIRALARLLKQSGINPKSKVFLDGGLFAGNGTKRIKGTRTIVKGDEKVKAIKIASIIAKVKRDQMMRRLAKKYPKYGFEIHKGYGTRHHRKMIKKHGPSLVHRVSFLKNI